MKTDLASFNTQTNASILHNPSIRSIVYLYFQEESNPESEQRTKQRSAPGHSRRSALRIRSKARTEAKPATTISTAGALSFVRFPLPELGVE